MTEIELLKLNTKWIIKVSKRLKDMDKKIEYLTEAVNLLVQVKTNI